MAAGPLYRFDDLASWARGLEPGRGRVDLGLAAVSGRGVEGRARVGYGLATGLDAFGEAWARWNRTWETGAQVGLEYRW